MVSKRFKCELLHLLWGEPTGEVTIYCQSLQLANNRIINKTNPVSSLLIHYWSIFKGVRFLERMWVPLSGQAPGQGRSSGEDRPDTHPAMKRGRCSALRNEGMLLPPDQIVVFQTPVTGLFSLDISNGFFNRWEDKGAYRRKTGKLVPSRQMSKPQIDSSLRGPLRACSTHIIDQMPHLKVFSRWIPPEEENKLRHVDPPTVMLQVQRSQQQHQATEVVTIQTKHAEHSRHFKKSQKATKRFLHKNQRIH